jgi:hypothetical protein
VIRRVVRGAFSAIAILPAALVGCGGRSFASTAYEQSDLANANNWAFRDRFPHADRLFNAFDYGHARLYETLITRRDARARLDGPEFDFITRDLLRHPPPVPLEEAAVGPSYATLIPEVVAMFDWAHALHRQIYDTWSAYGLTDDQRDAQVVRLIANYRARRDLAFSVRPKGMALMEGQPFSLAFRRQDPKFNGLLWSYHWLQMALYDALIQGRTEQQLQSGVDSTVDVFFAMIEGSVASMPREMPMSPGVAPIFSQRYPNAAIIFDNLHSLHDVVADILTSDLIPKHDKRAAILAAAAQYRDDTTAVVSVDEWRSMGASMSGRPR